MPRTLARLVTGGLALSATLAAGCAGSDRVSPTAVRADTEPVRVEVSPGAPSMLIGERVQLTAVAYTRHGVPLPNVEFSWITSDPSVAVVDQTGIVTSRGTGWAGVQAKAKTVAGFSRIAVGAN